MRKQPRNSMNWLAPGAVMALIIGSGMSLWIQVMNPTIASSYIPTSSGGATVSNLTYMSVISPSAEKSAIIASSSASTGTHRAADSITELLLQTKPVLMRLQLSSTLGRLPLRMKVGTRLTLQARGFYSNAPTAAKLVAATYSINGTVIPECKSANACAFKPAASGTYTLRISKDGKTADATIKVW